MYSKRMWNTSASAFMSSGREVSLDGDPDYIYYNASIVNDNEVSTVPLGRDPAISFRDTRATPIVADVSKYHFSIIRFTMNGPNKDLPLFIPQIRTGQSDINLTTYSVGIQMTKQVTIGGAPFTFNGYAQRFVRYRSESLPAYTATGQSLPNAPTTEQDIRGVYYYVYTYNWWLNLVNEALGLAITDPAVVPTAYNPTLSLQVQFNNFWTANGGVGPAPTIITEAPRIIWNPSSKTFSIYADTYSFGGSAALSFGTGAAGNEEASQLWFNANTFGLFTNFENTYLGAEATGQTNNITIENRLGTNIYFQNLPTLLTAPTAANSRSTTKSYWVMEQDYPSTSTLWSPIEAIVFNSTLLPLVKEQQTSPVSVGAGNDGTNNSTSADFSPIVTDIALPLSSADDYRQFIEYAPAAEYRMSDFTASRQSITAIDFQVFWRCRLDGRLYPLRAFNGSSVSIKCMFRKKGVN